MQNKVRYYHICRSLAHQGAVHTQKWSLRSVLVQTTVTVILLHSHTHRVLQPRVLAKI